MPTNHLTTGSKSRLSIIKYHYEHHLVLFKHSDDFVQQRTNQFSMMNTILFAFFGVITALISLPNNHNPILYLLAFIVSILGTCASYIWFCSYKRSVGYRRIHRDTLRQLDEIIGEEYGLDIDLENADEFPLLGPFQIRHHVMYERKTLPYSSSKDTYQIGQFSKKKWLSNVETIPAISFVLWIACIVATSYIFYVSNHYADFLTNVDMISNDISSYYHTMTK